MRHCIHWNDATIRIFETGGMVALDPLILDPEDRERFERAFAEIYLGKRVAVLSLMQQAKKWQRSKET